MAPLLAIYSKDEIRRLNPHLFPERVPIDDKDGEETTTTTKKKHQKDGSPIFKLDNDNCELFSLTQNQCTYDGNKTVCLPFKRLFARCIDTEYAKRNEIIGYKFTPAHSDFKNQKDKPRYRNVEITTEKDNDYLNDFYRSGDEEKKKLIDDFLKADKVLQEKMMQYMEKYRKEEQNK